MNIQTPNYFTNYPSGPAWLKAEDICKLLTTGKLNDGSVPLIKAVIGDEYSSIDVITNHYGSYVGANVIYSDRNARYHITIDTVHQQVRVKINTESASLNYLKDRWGLNDFIKEQFISKETLEVDDFYQEHVTI